MSIMRILGCIVMGCSIVLLLPYPAARAKSPAPAHGSSVAQTAAAVPSSAEAPAPTPKSQPAGAGTQPVDHAATDAMVEAVARGLHGELGEIRGRLDSLATTTSDKWLSAIIGFIGVLAGAGVTGAFAMILQRGRLAAEDRAEERKARREKIRSERDFGLGALSDMQAFRSRQLNEFYGPLRVLLAQIRVLRNEFDQRLKASIKEDSEVRVHFKGEGRRRHLMVSRSGAEEHGFRLIDEMGYVGREHPDLMSTVGELVSTGDLLAGHLHKHGGLLDPRSLWLSQQIAVYLAHQRVLKEIFDRVSKDASVDYIANYSTVYPRSLDILIERDYTRLNRSQAAWLVQATRWSRQIE